MQPVYLVCGVSGSGKSWACRQVRDKFFYVPHDACWVHPDATPTITPDAKWGPRGSKSVHLEVLLKIVKEAKKPVLTECPFAERELREGLERNGIKVIPVFVIEEPRTVAERYERREGKPIPKAALSRASSIINRAREWNGFYGTSTQVVEHLKSL